METSLSQEQLAAQLANAMAYDAEGTAAYVEGAPHIKHADLRQLYGNLIAQVVQRAQKTNPQPRILDLGAGEGSVTLPLLQLGASVTAVDLSSEQLAVLRQRCSRFEDRLEVVRSDIVEFLSQRHGSFDIAVANSFLHHVPDYLGLLRSVIPRLSPGGQFFSFQDPLRYDSLSPWNAAANRAFHWCWRIFQGDVWAGALRYLRRRRGVFLETCMEDNAEFHVVRNGVDQDAIRELFVSEGFDCDITPYFSTQSAILQRLGRALRLRNTFAVIAIRSQPSPVSSATSSSAA